jgi:hypothetical protein
MESMKHYIERVYNVVIPCKYLISLETVIR